MGIIPGGKSGLAKRTAESIDESAAQLVVVFTALCTLVGVFVTAFDFIASLRGWGAYMAGSIGEDSWFRFLAVVVSIAPQLIQITFSLLFMADLKFFNLLTGGIYVILFVLDSTLDYTYLISTGSEPFTAVVVVIGVFWILSEIMIGIFWPLTMALYKEVRAQRSKPALPGFMGGPPPSKGARPSAGPRAPSHRPGAPAPVQAGPLDEVLGKVGSRR